MMKRPTLENYVMPDRVVIPEFVMTIEQVIDWIAKAEELLVTPYDNTNMDAIQTRMLQMSNVLGAGADSVAAAKFYLAEVHKAQFDEVAYIIQGKKHDKALNPDVKPLIGTMALKEYIKNRCSQFIWLESKCSDLRSALVHSIDALRSALSKEKTMEQIAAQVGRYERSSVPHGAPGW